MADHSPSRVAPRIGPRTDRRRRRWCYDCATYTLTHAYPTDLLEGEIDVCDPCAAAANGPTQNEHDGGADRG